MKPVTTTLSDFPVPDSTRLEQQVIADVVANPETLGELTTLLHDGMFTNEPRKFIWKTIVWMYGQRETIDLISVHDRCGQHFLEEIIAPALVSSTALGTASHARLLRDSYAKRRAYQSAIELLQAASNPALTETDIYSESERLSRELREESAERGSSTLAEVVQRVGSEIEERIVTEQAGGKARVPTSFYTLDQITLGGWASGQLIILAARPSVGKTAIMLQMAKEAAQAKMPALIFSLEMTESELARRLLASTGRVRQDELSIGDNPWPGFEAAAGLISKLPIIIDDRSRFITDIVAKIILASERGECRAAFIDYLSLIKDREGGKLSLNQQIGNITAELKAVAKRAKVPIILLSQLNRDSAKDGRAPQLYDLRDSGSIEQDADVVLMLDAKPNIDDTTPDIDIWVRKNRQNVRDRCITVRPEYSYTFFNEIATK